MTTIFNTWSLCSCPNRSRNAVAPPVPPRQKSGLRSESLQGPRLPSNKVPATFPIPCAGVIFSYSSARFGSFPHFSRSAQSAPNALEFSTIQQKTHSALFVKNQNKVRNASNITEQPHLQRFATEKKSHNPALYRTFRSLPPVSTTIDTTFKPPLRHA